MAFGRRKKNKSLSYKITVLNHIKEVFHVGSPQRAVFRSFFKILNLEDLSEEKVWKLLPFHEVGSNETNAFITQKSKQKFLAYLGFYWSIAWDEYKLQRRKWNHFRAKAEARGVDSVGFEWNVSYLLRKTKTIQSYAGLIEHGWLLGEVNKKIRRNWVFEWKHHHRLYSDNGGVVLA